MRLVPWGQMLADVQASGFTPISWLRFSSRTALTTTCTASNIKAADSCGRGTQRMGSLAKGAREHSNPSPHRNRKLMGQGEGVLVLLAGDLWVTVASQASVWSSCPCMVVLCGKGLV